MTVQVSSSPPTAATGHLAVTHLATALWESLERHEAATHLDTALWTSFGRGLLFVHCTVQIYRDPRCNCDKMKIKAAHKFELFISAQKSFGLDKEIFQYIPLKAKVFKSALFAWSPE